MSADASQKPKDAFEELFPSKASEIVPDAPAGSLSVPTKADELAQIENAVYERNLAIVHAATYFADIEPGTTEPPKEWVDEVGEKEAKRRLRVANGAWMGAKDAPVGISISKAVVSSMAKARAMRDGGDRTLNVVVAQFVAPRYAELEVGSDD